MACTHWKDEWVALLYDELEPPEKDACTAHLAGCADCRGVLDSLALARRLLRAGSPAVPETPRVLVLRVGVRRAAWWGFAAGLAAAAVVLAVGPRLVGGSTAVAPQGSVATSLPAGDVAPVADDALARRLATMEQRVASLESRPDVPAPAAEAWLTRDGLAGELEALRRRVERDRARDLRYIMETLTASEIRTGTFMDRTQQALNLLALRQDPRIQEK